MTSPLHLSPLHEALVQSGFQSVPGGYERNEMRVQISARWLSFMTAGDPTIDLGRIALWKTVVDQGASRRVFCFPADLCLQEEETDGCVEALRACIDWAVHSAEACIPAGWEAPTVTAIHAVIPSNRFVIQHGPIVRRIELICTPERLALRVPLATLPPDLPADRLAWLESVLHDMQSQWHMVRLGVAEMSAGMAALGEVDLTGAPGTFVLPLLLAARDSLWWAVVSLAETADFLADAALASQALAICAAPTTHNVEKETAHENY